MTGAAPHDPQKTAAQITLEWQAIETKRPGGRIPKMDRVLATASLHLTPNEQDLLDMLGAIYRSNQQYHQEMGVLIAERRAHAETQGALPEGAAASHLDLLADLAESRARLTDGRVPDDLPGEQLAQGVDAEIWFGTLRPDALRALAATLRARLSAEPLESARLSRVLERDRTRVADGVSAAQRVLDGYSWLAEGRGPYAHDDAHYQQEFASAMRELSAALEPLRRVGADWSDCPAAWADVQAARRSVPALPLDHARDVAEAVSVLDLVTEWRFAEDRLNAEKAAWRAGGAAHDAADFGDARRDFDALDDQVGDLSPTRLRVLSRAVQATAITLSRALNDQRDRTGRGGPAAPDLQALLAERPVRPALDWSAEPFGTCVSCETRGAIAGGQCGGCHDSAFIAEWRAYATRLETALRAHTGPVVKESLTTGPEATGKESLPVALTGEEA
ncbi:hypothetical protein [Deinococcus soli (ex Cha et al. 2016)]|uniref:Uncharacterized protein n=2 Tax=Deinococcus soli (ex Cha et al. 2016) TaxID=1309411 RepID=A0AAE3XDE0_9DEIO|nr:hypothetical protein [Deinococcus soli (ex Cha et al. 2016)]MDR6218604.1 hypothetical protein [Deinococcus soli (ex Cha et al. 2016)]MDR6328401.1 hypothetical protein [Deinococcus soli (ex Cha et al. 2016)]MDR6753012.1 hypothetical protein [Deinococcus soli (ex Cha et al. 2016)]